MIPGCMGVFSPLMHGCEALLAFLQFPLALQSVFAHHFVAWRPFHSLEAMSCSQREKKNIFVDHGKIETF